MQPKKGENKTAGQNLSLQKFNMATQNFQHHKRFNLPYHFITVPLLFISTCIAVYNFWQHTNLTNALLVIILAFIGVVALFARWFGLRNQDRVARAEERLRYYILTQQMLPSNLRMGQILALRFASDEEFVALVARAVAEQLPPEAIKKSIKNWRADYYRI